MADITPDYAELLERLEESPNHAFILAAYERRELLVTLRTLLEHNAALERERDQLRDKLHCMCGSPIDHSAWEGHTPVSVYDYSLDQERSRAEAAEARLAEARKLIRSTHKRAVTHANCEDEFCAICVGGLFVCADCGAVEAEAEERICTGKAPISLAAAEKAFMDRVWPRLQNGCYRAHNLIPIEIQRRDFNEFVRDGLCAVLEASETDYFGSLVERARAAAAKASAKFPQPNYVTLKIAEEAGEVIRGAVHYAERRMEWSEVEAEIIQLLAMLIRFVTEGDQVNGIIPPTAGGGE